MDTKVVRRNNEVQIAWVIKNYQPKTTVSLDVDTDPGAGFGTTAVAAAPDANTGKNGAGKFGTVMPQLGSFIFTLTIKKPGGDEKKQTKVVVEELTYKSFTASAAKIELGTAFKLSWEIEVADGCTFKLQTTDPFGAQTQTDVTVDAKGKGSLTVKPAVIGTHKFKLLSADPTLKQGQTSPSSSDVAVEVRDQPTLNITYADDKKPSLSLSLLPTVFDTPAPAYKLTSGNFVKTAAFQKAANFATIGGFSALQDVPASLKQLHVEVFASLALANSPGAKPILTQDWHFAPGNPGDPPMWFSGTLPPGKLGEPFLDAGRIQQLGLSAKRIKMINQFLPMVMPSKVGSAAFDNLQTKASVDATVEASKPATYTTCVTVPTFLSRQYKEPKHDFPMGGIVGCYWAATEAAAFSAGSPAWIVAEKGLPKKPKPGDLFIIAGKDTTADFIKGLAVKKVGGKRTDAFECLHIGVIVDVSSQVTIGGGQLWVVCQAGMGAVDAQEAGYTYEVIDPDGPKGPMLGGRRLGGWIDIDNYNFWT